MNIQIAVKDHGIYLMISQNHWIEEVKLELSIAVKY